MTIALVGMTVDYGSWIHKRTHMQSVADAAALAAAAAYGGTGDTALAQTSAGNVLAAHGLDGANPVLELLLDGEAFRVSLQEQGEAYFAGLFHMTPPLLNVTSTAAIPVSGVPCVVTLDPSSGESISLASNAEIEAPDCVVVANSTSSRAIWARSNAELRAKGICTPGGWGGAGNYTPEPRSCAGMSDPLAHLQAPEVGPCEHTNFSLPKKGTSVGPGVYCGGLVIDNNSDITFEPGLYVIKDGEFRLESNTEIYGDGVVFYFTGTNARVNFNSNSLIHFKAPTTGDLAGVVLFEDRDSPPHQVHELRSNSNVRLEGAVYLSRGVLRFNSNSQIVAESPSALVVVNRLELDSFAHLTLTPDYDAAPAPAGTIALGRVRLIE